MARRFQVVFLLLLVTLPICILIKEFSAEHGFLDRPLFGKLFIGQAMPVVREINPPARTEFGYDGQFYAQLALSPLLADPDLIRAINRNQQRLPLREPTTKRTSAPSKESKGFVCGPTCTSAIARREGCITSCLKWSITRSTRRSMVSPARSL
jgi:hypothetical protein